LKTGQSLGVLGYFVGQELQGYEAVELDVLSLVDDTHTTTAQLLNDSVMRDGVVNHEDGRSRIEAAAGSGLKKLLNDRVPRLQSM
jgi:hypothetical protein